jgi:hypothetical protein
MDIIPVASGYAKARCITCGGGMCCDVTYQVRLMLVGM